MKPSCLCPIPVAERRLCKTKRNACRLGRSLPHTLPLEKIQHYAFLRACTAGESQVASVEKAHVWEETRKKKSIADFRSHPSENSDMNPIFMTSNFDHVKIVFPDVPTVIASLFCWVSITLFSPRHLILHYRCVYEVSKQGRFLKALGSSNSSV